MTDLSDLERRLRNPYSSHSEDFKTMTEAADLIASLQQMGEGLPEPSAFMKHVGGLKFFMGNFEIAQREGYETSIFTREQMLAYGAAQREKALEEAAKVCDDYAEDKWALYKGRKPYDGSESGRADPDTQGHSDGAAACADSIRALKGKQ